MIAIVGGGRMGRSLASVLSEAGERVVLWSRREASGAVTDAIAGAQTVLLAVPDDVLDPLARELASGEVVGADQVVLHLSGVHDRRILAPLGETGASLGSLHPLQTISEPGQAGARWRGAYAAIEGDTLALEEAERLCGLLGLVPVRLPEGAKVAYHAGAVVASNYVVVLAEVAARIAEAGGVPREAADRMYLPLLRGAAENLQRQLPADALTGPIRRGDAATVRRHLSVLGEPERTLYAQLGLRALALARGGGLSQAAAEEIERLLRNRAGVTGPQS
ncbi:MAG: DUF2520 domain-containing protein [Gemmatimonadota bacterium]|nr:DUF2520 domain-containing protein [Gemmatimonadota bacterium]